jgi:hypothetical protein
MDKNIEDNMILFTEWCSENFHRTYPKGANEIVWWPRITFNGIFKKELHTTTDLLNIWKEQQN